MRRRESSCFALAGSVLANEADNLPGTDVEICGPEHRQFAPTRPIPRRYDLVMPFAISPPTSPSGVGIAVDTVIGIAIGVAGPMIVTGAAGPMIMTTHISH